MMETLSLMGGGLASAFAPMTLLYCFIGVTVGTFVGVLPGIGPLATVSMLLPLTFYLEPTQALVMLAGIYYGSQYGGSTASILLNLPGDAGSAITCLDGYPLARQGKAGTALFVTTIGSFIGGCFAILVLVFLAPPLGRIALSMTSAEYFAMMLLGIIAAVTLVNGSVLKGIAMVALGLVLGLMGTDVMSGTIRFAFDIPYLYDGANLVLVAMGLFGVSEVLASIGSADNDWISSQKIRMRNLLPSREDMNKSWGPIARGSLLGSVMGIVPGAGTTIPAFLAYAFEKRVSKTPERFGKGAIEGVAAPETANNAASQTAFIPTLTLGVPGGPTMALMLGALMIHGITPGPQLITQHPDVFWGLIGSFWVGNLILLVLNLPMVGIWVWMLKIPYRILYPGILVFICLGVYSVNYSFVDVLMVCGFGILGYVLMLLRFEPAPLLLGFVLGPMMEENLRRTLLISNGDFAVFIQRPICAGLLLVCLALLAMSLYGTISGRRKKLPGSEDSMAITQA
jgi:TctA family transporter